MVAWGQAGYRTPQVHPPNAAAQGGGGGGVWCGFTMVQHDLEGRALFLHRNLDKLNKRAVRPVGDGGKVSRVPRWETVYHWVSGEVGVWGEVRVEYGCKPRATVWLAGNTSDARFVDYLGGGAWAAGLNDLVEEALDQLLAAG